MVMQAPTRIAPSLLAADFTRLAEEVRAIEAAGADMLHLDIMDGHFVPNISFGPAVVAALRKVTQLTLDVHLMIQPADPFIGAFCDAGADIITVHPEAGPHLHRTLQSIRARGKQAGVALNPGTPVEAIAHVIGECDLVLAMTVNPGFGGQKFIAAMLPKIAVLRALIDAQDRPIALEVDGGVTVETAPGIVRAGADLLVAGTAVFGAQDYATAIMAMRRA